MQPAVVALAAFCLALSLAGCANDQQQATAPEAAPQSAAATTPGVAGEPHVEDLVPMGFGESISWRDGLTVTVSEPKPYTLEGEGDAGYGTVDHPHHVTVDVTMTNKGEEAYQTTDFMVSVQSAGTGGGVVFGEPAEEELPGSVILPGEDASATYVLAVADPSDIVVEVHRDYSGEPALFVTH